MEDACTRMATSLGVSGTFKRENEGHDTMVAAKVGKPPIHQRDQAHIGLAVEATFGGSLEMPMVEAYTGNPPVGLIPFSEAVTRSDKNNDCFVHFYEDDFRFERIWNDPSRYLHILKRFRGAVMPDFSTCIDYPKPLKIWNAYRNCLLASWFQREGLQTIPSGLYQPGCPWLIDSLSHGGILAVCGRGLAKDVDERRRFKRDLKVTLDMLDVAGIVYYGSVEYGMVDYPRALGIPVYVYPGNGKGSMGGVRSGMWI